MLELEPELEQEPVLELEPELVQEPVLELVQVLELVPGWVLGQRRRLLSRSTAPLS